MFFEPVRVGLRDLTGYCGAFLGLWPASLRSLACDFLVLTSLLLLWFFRPSVYMVSCTPRSEQCGVLRFVDHLTKLSFEPVTLSRQIPRRLPTQSVAEVDLFELLCSWNTRGILLDWVPSSYDFPERVFFSVEQCSTGMLVNLLVVMPRTSIKC